MPPRKVPTANGEDQNGQGENIEGRSLRARKVVDYETTRKRAVSGKEKIVNKKVKYVIDALNGDPSNSENPTRTREKPEVVGASRKPRKTSVIKEKTSKPDLNSTFEVKSKTANKVKINAPTNSKIEDQTETKKTEADRNIKLNDTNTKWSELDLSKSLCTHTNSGEEWNLKISSWNVDGLRAWLKKDGGKFLDYEKPDILCLQETKCSESKVPSEAKFEGYHSYWAAAGKKGYSGVGLLSKEEPISIKLGMDAEEHDNEGRLITAQYKKFYLVTTYVPNAGRNLVTLPKRLSWDAALRKYLKHLDSHKPVILCGDMNVAHEEIDIANPKTNTKNAGFTKEERAGMTELLALGFADTFRHLYPEKTGAYTFWTYMKAARSRNVGWRLDYFIVSERIIDQVCDSFIRNQILGSDHCPITLLFHNK